MDETREIGSKLYDRNAIMSSETFRCEVIACIVCVQVLRENEKKQQELRRKDPL